MLDLKLKGAFLTLTNKCNLHCSYCYQNSCPTIDTKKELKKKDWIKIIDALTNFGVGKICLVGGEPFLYESFWEILDYIKKKGLAINIFTNGHFLDVKKIKQLQSYGILLSFNLNSHNHEIQDFYQGKGSWEKTIKSMELCKEKLEFEIASPLMKKNYIDIGKFIDFCVRLGVKRIRFVPLILSNTKSDLRKEMLSGAQFLKLKKKFAEEKRIEITIGCRVCEAGKYYLTIQPNGEVTPCTLKRNMILGNIKKDSMKCILKKGKRIKIIPNCIK